jgi:hypothetical protein
MRRNNRRNKRNWRTSRKRSKHTIMHDTTIIAITRLLL